MPVISDIGAHVKALLVEVGRRAKLSAAAAKGLSGEAFTKQASLYPVVSSGLLATGLPAPPRLVQSHFGLWWPVAVPPRPRAAFPFCLPSRRARSEPSALAR